MKRIPLTRGQFALIDDDDFNKFGGLKWFASLNKKTGSFYASRGVGPRKKRRIVRLHREIMGSPEGLKVDHRNHNTLDNRKENLRICTNSQNMMNRKGP